MKTANVMLLCIVMLVFSSTSMLAMSIDHLYLVPIAVAAICLSIVLTDWLKWISIEGWLANSISLLILLFAMRNFFDTDSAGKLISVAKLLVYLQAVLLFQKKTARLTWQILVLGLLQVVVTTIFSVNFEGGLLFIVFFVAGCLALFLQNSMVNSQIIDTSNEHSAARLAQINENKSENQRLAWWRSSTRPIAEFETPQSQQKFSLSHFGTFPAIVIVASLFTFVLFLTAPRHVKPWFSPITYKVVATGVSNSVDPYETGKIVQSSQRMFRAKFRSELGTEVNLSYGPYFRGIALSTLKIEDGRTKFVAPYERIYNEHYETLREPVCGERGRIVNVDITVEQNSDPVVYSMSPAFRGDNTPAELRFCQEISALTRCRQGEQIVFAPFSYEYVSLVNLKTEPLGYWPYIANNGSTKTLASMDNDLAQFKWLTWMEKERYPELVRIADGIARDVRQSGGGRIKLVKKLEEHFLNPLGYDYTLDYTNVQRDGNVDPIEDFVANFRKGHCTAFASAMVLMLRSQNIPARLVVGFHGGEYNSLSNSWLVRGKHAHAWVEVYLRPEDCTEDMKQTVECDVTGVWLTADPTPAQPDEQNGLGTDDAIDLARSVWQDYVLGMESNEKGGEEAPMTMSVARLLQAFDLDQLPATIDYMKSKNSLAFLRPLMIVGALLAILGGIVRYFFLASSKEDDGPETTVGRIRKLLADAIGLISSDLREWLIGDHAETAFYRRFAEVMEKHNMVRSPQQTHREFAHQVCEQLSSHPARDEITASVGEVTELFNRVRFGGKPLDTRHRESVDERIEQLEQLLRVSTSS